MKNRWFVAVAFVAMLTTVLVPPRVSAQRMSGNDKVVPDPGVTLKVTVVISRWEGDKKVGNSPYVLMVVPSYGARAESGADGDQVFLQMGSEYPLPAAPSAADGKPTINYKTLGTNLQASARPIDDGKFNLRVSVQDSQVDKPHGTNQVLPSFQTFRSDNRLTMRDGQTLQYTVATDTISGQIIKLDVTLNVLK